MGRMRNEDVKPWCPRQPTSRPGHTDAFRARYCFCGWMIAKGGIPLTGICRPSQILRTDLVQESDDFLGSQVGKQTDGAACVEAGAFHLANTGLPAEVLKVEQ
jgi:hypothetical protein